MLKGHVNQNNGYFFYVLHPVESNILYVAEDKTLHILLALVECLALQYIVPLKYF